jgi:hypothetical protein
VGADKSDGRAAAEGPTNGGADKNDERAAAEEPTSSCGVSEPMISLVVVSEQAESMREDLTWTLGFETLKSDGGIAGAGETLSS